jgi:hypothetical protein
VLVWFIVPEQLPERRHGAEVVRRSVAALVATLLVMGAVAESAGALAPRPAAPPNHDWRTAAPKSWHIADSRLKQSFPDVLYSRRSSGSGWAGAFSVYSAKPTAAVPVRHPIAAAFYYNNHHVALAHERGLAPTRVLYFSNVAVELYPRASQTQFDAATTCFTLAGQPGLLPTD